ncbi:MAG TPA: phosphopantetheine-binding protein [Bryobacteraceae bacterium]|nr:phosphopantetheine-binding protein [Bryobacteraceae bacterium]
MTDHRARLSEFLASIAAARGAPLESDALDLDSLALLQVVTYLEQNYGIRLADHDVEPDDLRSVDGILSLIERFADAASSR